MFRPLANHWSVHLKPCENLLRITNSHGSFSYCMTRFKRHNFIAFPFASVQRINGLHSFLSCISQMLSLFHQRFRQTNASDKCICQYEVSVLCAICSIEFTTATLT